MNFDLSEEQAMLKESLGRFLAERYPFEKRRALTRDALGWDRDAWQWLAAQGYLGLPFAETDGGLGGGAIEMMLVAETLGAHLVAEPYLATVILGGTALRLSADKALCAGSIKRITTGELTLAFVHDEPGGRSPSAVRRTNAFRDAGQWRVNGVKDPVIHGASADRLIVTARADEGLGIFLIDASSAGIVRRDYATFDGLRAAEIRLDAVAADPIAIGSEAESLVERVLQHGIAFIAAEAVGLMRLLLDLTVEHLNTRKQFGQALADFQALRHRAVEMLIATEQAESAKIYAAMMTESPDPLERRKALAAVKAVVGPAARAVGQGAVQLHGGIGVTDEHRVGWAMRRLTMIEMMLGDTDHHVAQLAELGGFLAVAE
jgi:alkylation response protein AidB-like acyl-CoA dehydrogenase